MLEHLARTIPRARRLALRVLIGADVAAVVVELARKVDELERRLGATAARREVDELRALVREFHVEAPTA